MLQVIFLPVLLLSILSQLLLGFFFLCLSLSIKLNFSEICPWPTSLLIPSSLSFKATCANSSQICLPTPGLSSGSQIHILIVCVHHLLGILQALNVKCVHHAAPVDLLHRIWSLQPAGRPARNLGHAWSSVLTVSFTLIGTVISGLSLSSPDLRSQLFSSLIFLPP